MATIDIRRPRGRGFFGLLVALRDRVAEARRRRAIYVRTRDELLSLTDRDLADLDIERSRVPEIARQAAAQA